MSPAPANQEPAAPRVVTLGRGRRVVARGVGPVLLAILVAVAASGGAGADSARDHSVITLEIENDLFGSGKDRHFTHGTRISWISGEDDVPDPIRRAAAAFPLFDATGRTRVSYALGQSIFTPEDIRRENLVRDDRPYAGWLYAGASLISDTGSRLDAIELDIGVIGPASLAEDVQTTWHEWIGSPRPRGWDNQLRNEPGVVLYYDRTWRAMREFEALGHALDVAPHIGGSIGNVLTHVGMGATVRFGRNLPNDYGPPLIRPGIPGSGFFAPSSGIGWYLFAGGAARIVARDIFLDGNTFRDSHRVDRRPLVGEVQAGIAVTVRRVRLAYTHVLRSNQFDGQDTPDHYGAITLSVAF